MLRFLGSRKALAAVLVCVFLAVLVMTSLTPMLADDFSYSFSYAEPGKRIASLGDVFRSLAAHRQIMNGRMISHGLAMLFLMAPKAVFNFFNAAHAALFALLVYLWLPTQRRARALALLLLALTLLWLCTPVFGQVWLWLDGSLNYAWAMSAMLLFLYPFYCRYLGKPCRLSPVFSIPFAFLAGAYSENASCAALFMAFCFGALALLRDRRLPLRLYLAFASGCLGFLFLMTAPAESGRAAQTELLGIARNIQQIFVLPRDALLPLYCLSAALFTLALLGRARRELLVSAAILFAGSLVSIGVFVFALYFPWRSLCAATVLLVLGCLVLLAALWERGMRALTPLLLSVTTACFIFSFVLGLGDIAVLFLEGRERDATLRAAAAAGADTVEVHQYSSITKYAASYLLPDVYDTAWMWPNYDVAKYYGVGEVVGLPPVEVFGSE